MSKQVNLVGIKVLGDNGSGSMSGVISGIEWAVKDAQKREGGVAKAVANMSLGGGKSAALNQAVKSAVDAGLVMVVAAGNDGVGDFFTLCLGWSVCWCCTDNWL